MNNRAARIFFAVNFLLLSPALVVAQTDKTDKPFVKQPLAHTYSIVARDPETGQLGVAVQPKSKLLPDDQKIIQRILSVAPPWKR